MVPLKFESHLIELCPIFSGLNGFLKLQTLLGSAPVVPLKLVSHLIKLCP